jgi:chromate reductase, NAD(P)H dehydrogenase (quinone)
MLKVAVLVGSLRADSINRRLALAIASLAPPDLEFEFVQIGDLPFFNEDLEAAPPPAVLRLRRQIAQTDAVLFVTPEYNRSIPAVLKNAIDWASRPYFENRWPGKAGAVISASLGASGGVVAQAHLRSVLISQGVELIGRPEVALHYTADLIGEHGEVANESTRAFLQDWTSQFAAFVRRAKLPQAA